MQNFRAQLLLRKIARLASLSITGRPFVKRFVLCYGTVVLFVCDVRVLWPNGWMEQDETWHGGGPQSRPHCARWGPSSLPKRGSTASQFSANVYCCQTAGWIKMPLGSTEVGLDPGHIVLDGDPAPPKRGIAPNFRSMSILAKRLHVSEYHLLRRKALA